MDNREYDYDTLKAMLQICERHDSYAMAKKLLDIYGFNAEQEIHDTEHWSYYSVDDYYVVMGYDEEIVYVTICETFDDVIDYVDNWLEYVDGKFQKVEIV